MQSITEKFPLLTTIDPASYAAGEQLSAAIPLAQIRRILAVIQTGVLGTSATVDAQLKGATSSGGTYTAIPNTAITQIVKASGDNKQVEIELDSKAVENLALSYTHVKLSVVVAVAASIVAAQVRGDRTRWLDGSLYNPASLQTGVALLN